MRATLRTAIAALAAALIPLLGAPGARAADNGNDAVRVMSFNIRYGTAADGPDHWNKRKDLVLETIRAFAPDLLGIQEALAFQVDWLADRLEGYTVVGAGRDDGKRAGEFTAIYYKTDRFEKLAEGHFWLSPTPDKPGSKGWDTAITRMCSWVRLRDKSHTPDAGEGVGGEILFMNTHWDHMGRRARAESANVIRAHAKKLAYGGEGDNPPPAVIIAGDFNCTEDDEPYARMVRPAEADEPTLLDSYRQAHPERGVEEATFHGFRGGRAGSRIDWILHTAEFKPTEAAIDHTNREGRYPSDHYPVTAVLERTGK